MNTPIQISNYFIEKSLQASGSEPCKPLTPMKLIKLTYISHGWSLALLDEPLLSELVEAWRYGPVVSAIYREFKSYGNRTVTSMAIAENGEIPTINDNYNPKVKALLDKIWDVYNKYDGIELSAMTHQPGTPWDTVWNKLGGKHKKSAPISNALIAEHYNDIIAKNGKR